MYNDKEKCSLVSWKKIYQPKENGGLGFRIMKDCNSAFLLTLVWQLVTKANNLWVKILKAKYLNNQISTSKIRNSKGGSHLWNGVRRIWPMMLKQTRRVVINGRKVRFWLDNWLTDKLASCLLSLQSLRFLKGI